MSDPFAALSRRQFVQGLAASGVAATFGFAPRVLRAESLFDLVIGTAPVNVTGRVREAVLINGTLPGPLLTWQEGVPVRIRVRNELAEATSIHWHGILLPYEMDGVPGLSFPGIAPGETFEYRFTPKQSGTYWYHSHSGLQEQLGHYAPLVVLPRKPDPDATPREHVIVLSDWTDEGPERVLAKLKKRSDYYNYRQPTLGDFFRDARQQGLSAAVAERRAWGEMRMNRSDLADVTAATYTYLVNGQSPAANWTGLTTPGERLRLRFVNAAAMTIFDVRIPGLELTVVAADGQPVEPVRVEEFRIGPAETYDVVVTPEDRAYTLFAQSIDRSGHARGTLAPRAGMTADVPAMDAPVLLSLADMGHGDHGGHGGTGDHSGHGAHGGAGEHAGHEGHAMPATAVPGIAVLPDGPRHAPAESGPGVDMVADAPVMRLDDPGVGLRDNGRRVLTYAALRSRFPDPDGREPTRTIELHLTGHMARYQWSFNGVRSSDAAPIGLVYGERVRFVVVNDTMMEHPLHLHGLWSDLEDEQGRFLVRKHTLSVKPGQFLSFRVSADALGRWAMHCHLLMHMETGMFREVRVTEEGGRG